MLSGEFSDVAPPHFTPWKLSTFEEKDMHETRETSSIVASKSFNASATKVSRVHNSSRVADNFVIMAALKSKTLTLRDLLDLSPCFGSASVNELLILTMKDLHKMHPSVDVNVPLSSIDEAGMDQALRCFCDTLKSIGAIWTKDDEFIAKLDEEYSNLRNDLRRYGLVLLDEMIKLATERVFDMMDEDDQTRDESPTSNGIGRGLLESHSSNESCLSSPPPTPTSVLSSVISASPKSGLKAQSTEKLNPLDVKRLYFDLLPYAIAQDPNYVVQRATNLDEEKSEVQAKLGQDVEMLDSTDILVTDMDYVSENGGTCRTGSTNNEPVSSRVSLDVVPELRSDVEQQAAAPPAALFTLSSSVIKSPSLTSRNILTPLPPPPPPPMTSRNIVTPLPPPPPPPMTSRNIVTPLPPPPPPPMTSRNIVTPLPPPPSPPLPPPHPMMVPPPPSLPRKTATNITTLPPPPPPPPTISRNAISPPPPPPPPIGSKGMAPPPQMASNRAVPAPPPPMPTGKGPAPPPSLGFIGVLRVKRAATKLKRSSQMGNLYRLLKNQVEGCSSLDSHSHHRMGKVGASAGGKQGMADALAEMTKRSAYFHQIEEDVKIHAKTIMDMKTAISSFKSSDMSELIKFHRYVESHLEKLTDESQVLARFEDFPTKKLEELRMAATLYSKLDTISTTLRNWPIISPVGEHLDKAESYFNKIKVEIDTLERTKDEEIKKFKSHNIHFDFGILVRIKELMVDVSSNCMELVLKERREAKTRENGRGGSKNDRCKKGSRKLLWTAFQFAFRVYSFAGGQDDRADKLTRELAQEIQTDPNQ